MIIINGQQVKYSQSSLSVEEAIEERSVCSFEVVDTEGALSFRKGEAVEYYNNNVLEFSGVIESVKELEYNGKLYHDIQCIDWHYAADKRRYAGGHENQSAGDIVRTILTNKLAVEGITEGLIESGPIIIEARFNYAKISDCFDSLAEKSGFWWKIDQHKKLHFVARATYNAPFPITAAEMKERSVSIEKGNPKYRNRQYIKGGKDITDPQFETKVGDGESRAFVVGFPIAKVPTVEVNGVAQTVGIRGLQEEKEWYWSKGSNTISQDDNGIPLSTTDRIKITYQGEFDIVALSENPEEIEARKGIEGGSGIIEDVEDDMDITSRESAFQAANAKLEKYGVIGRKLKFVTSKSGLQSGQIVTVNYPIHGLNNAEMLIESISLREESKITWYEVSCVEGPVSSSWSKMFYHMATRGQAFIIRENIREDQVLILLAQFEKTWSSNTLLNLFREIYPGTNLYPNASQYPTFAPEHRVKYVSWLTNGVEVGRKPITRKTMSDTEINSTVYLAPYEANVQIDEVGWASGIEATNEIGTGIVMDKQIYGHTKTSLEAIQIDKRDIRGW